MKPSVILMIEDDPAVAQSLQDGLSRAGFEVIWKSNGTKGVLYAQQNTVHLILLDVRLPDGSGFDFCRQMRQKGLLAPIIILTAQHEALDKVLGLELGADDYVTKPFDLHASGRSCAGRMANFPAPKRTRSPSATCGST